MKGTTMVHHRLHPLVGPGSGWESDRLDGLPDLARRHMGCCGTFDSVPSVYERRKIMTKSILGLALCMCALLAYTSSSHAIPLIDPSTLQIGPGSGSRIPCGLGIAGS